MSARNHARIDRLLMILLFGLMSGFTVAVIASGDAPWPLLAILVIGWTEVALLAWMLLAAAPRAERLDAADNARADAGWWEDAR